MAKRERLSHNLRTPLTTITLALDLCVRKGEKLSPSARQELLRNALDQARRLELAIVEVEDEATRQEASEENDVIVLHEESAEAIRVRGRKLLEDTRSTDSRELAHDDGS